MCSAIIWLLIHHKPLLPSYESPTLLPQSTTAQGYLALQLDTARVDGFLVNTDNGSTRPRAVFYGDFRQITPQLWLGQQIIWPSGGCRVQCTYSLRKIETDHLDFLVAFTGRPRIFVRVFYRQHFVVGYKVVWGLKLAIIQTTLKEN